MCGFSRICHSINNEKRDTGKVGLAGLAGLAVSPSFPCVCSDKLS